MNYRINSPLLLYGIPKQVPEIIQTALESVNPEQIVLQNIHLEAEKMRVGLLPEMDLRSFKHVYVTGAGKAVAGMAAGIKRVLGERVAGGVIVTKHVPDELPDLGRIQVLKGNHPVPGTDSVHSSRQLIRFSSRFSGQDLVFCLITGGGSALLTEPAEGLSLENLQEVTALLLRSGAAIQEINILRKHLDALKGGGLARLFHPARVITLILSDVIGNPLDLIASGPTIADPSTYADAWQILRKYRLHNRIPKAVADCLQEGINGKRAETVKPGDPVLDKVDSMILGDNRHACQAAFRRAIENGFNAHILTHSLQGEARTAGMQLAQLLKDAAASGHPVARPFCILAGGETTVHITGNGKGGRNQEMALAAVPLLQGIENIAMIPFATDGEDGPTDAAGAVVTGSTFAAGLALGMNPEDYLANNDSYHYFRNLNAALTPGPTGTNVNDICFLFAW